MNKAHFEHIFLNLYTRLKETVNHLSDKLIFVGNL